MFFFFIFLHFFKGLFFFSYRLKKVWFRGLLIFLFLIIEAFMGYVLVWAQISFWASVVITSLLTVIPFVGFKIVFWVWGGFSVSGATLKFFFVLHFLVPLFLVIFLVFHLIFLHETGRTSKIYFCGRGSKVTFFPFFWFKDFYNFIIFFFLLFILLSQPFILGDSEMFLEADYLNSPVHIVPEWYFLFAYAILRSISNKFLGVIFLIFRILIFFRFLCVTNYLTVIRKFYKLVFYFFFFVSLFLSWLGQCQVEYPFQFLGIFFTVIYFFFIFLMFVFFVFRFFFFSFILIIILIFKI